MYTYDSLGGNRTVHIILERLALKELRESIKSTKIRPISDNPEDEPLQSYDDLRFHWKIDQLSCFAKKNSKIRYLSLLTETHNISDHIFSSDINTAKNLSIYPEKEMRIMQYLYAAGQKEVIRQVLKNGIANVYLAEFVYCQAQVAKNEQTRQQLEIRLNEYLKKELESDSGLVKWFDLGTDEKTPEERMAILAAFTPAPKPAKTSKRLSAAMRKHIKLYSDYSAQLLVAPDGEKIFNLSISPDYYGPIESKFMIDEDGQTVLHSWSDPNYVYTGQMKASANIYYPEENLMESIFDYSATDIHPTVRWIDAQTLEVRLDKNIILTNRENSIKVRNGLYEDRVEIRYIELDGTDTTNTFST